MQFFENLIEKAEQDRATVLSMLASPLVHVAVCEGVDFEESEWIRPFRETLEISVDLVGFQVTDDEYRLGRIRELAAWLKQQQPSDRDAVLTSLKMICTDVATASADETGNHVSQSEHEALKEIAAILEW